MCVTLSIGAPRYHPAALGATLTARPKLQPYAASLLYRTLGKALPDDAASAAFLLPLAMMYTAKHYEAVGLGADYVRQFIR